MQAKSYRTVAAPAQDEFTEKKSRFIGFIAPVTTEQEAAEFVEEIRARHRRPGITAMPTCCGRATFPAFPMTGSPPAPPDAPFWRCCSARS